MTSTGTTKWLTVCIYYSGQCEYFLAKAVKPYVDVVLQTGVAERFYFERHWNGRPCIRLYFKGNDAVLENILRPNLQEHFQQSIEAIMFNSLYDKPAALCSKVHFGQQEQVAGHPMGAVEMALCEQQFQLSSTTVLSLIKEKIAQWGFHELTGTAVKLHLGLAFATGLSLPEAARFFQVLELDWMLKYEEKTEEPEGSLIQHFKNSYDALKGDLVSYHSAHWELFKNQRKLGSSPLWDWLQGNMQLANELESAVELGSIGQVAGPFSETQFEISEKAATWNLYAQFVLLTNNRLGIRDQQEGFLFYAMSKSLRMLVSTYHQAGRRAGNGIHL